MQDVKQLETQPMPEINKCDWLLVKGKKKGEVCGKTSIGHRYCTTHRECDPNMQKDYVKNDDYGSEEGEVEDMSKKVIIIDMSTVSSFDLVVRRRNMKFIII